VFQKIYLESVLGAEIGRKDYFALFCCLAPFPFVCGNAHKS